MCRAIGEHGAVLIEDVARVRRGGGPVNILTHCNAGALATGGIGTATAPMYLAHERGLDFSVYADETRPLLQGARLTAFELAAAGIDVTLICDDMAAQVMRERRIGMVITGADRIAATGLYEDQARGIMRTSDPELRIRDQELDGVDGEVIYGILGACQRAEDDEIAAAMVKIYNDFAADFCRARPERFAMIGILPQDSPTATAAEVHRCETLGLRGVELPVTETMMPLWHPDWEPLWGAVAETGLPLHMHCLLYTSPSPRDGLLSRMPSSA